MVVPAAPWAKMGDSSGRRVRLVGIPLRSRSSYTPKIKHWALSAKNEAFRSARAQTGSRWKPARGMDGPMGDSIDADQFSRVRSDRRYSEGRMITLNWRVNPVF